MQRWLQQYFFQLGAGFKLQADSPAIEPRGPGPLAARGQASHASPRRSRTRRAIVVTTLPSAAGRVLEGISLDNASRVRLRVDPSDGGRTRICGRMADVCDALDALIAREAARDAALLVQAHTSAD
ncbi:hypothetical protein [Sphaerotilus mobilis]|uniref:Uncharacterized protein n=1 Tax=Sphaerotilus mobilis TaxID=47994 RepID=A0A4Q7LSM4_9BURK|nr:hypothetical protein [Sphaerotilus mobilis]RZS57845.1 hypothetical protein EV685_0118 [Sphaerotilus mobilis]